MTDDAANRTEQMVLHVWDTSKPKRSVSRLVEVKWLDAACTGTSNWEDPNVTQEAELAKALTVGYVWEETDEYIKVVASITTSHQHGNGVVIPMGCVQEIRELRR
jgi:hypothetical protein